MQIEQSTLRATPSGICTVEDGVIYEVNALYNTKTRIGVTDSKYEELKKLADTYYDKLVEVGAIIPPKTPEQLQAETMQLMNGMLEQMKVLKAEMEVLKNERGNTSADVESKPAGNTEVIASLEPSKSSLTGGKQLRGRTKGN